MTHHSTRARRRFTAAASVSMVASLALVACSGGGGGGDQPAADFTEEYTGPAVELAFWNGLSFLGGRKRLAGQPLHALLVA